MKKLISIVIILFCFATLYGQDTKPTKQETMDWIAGKMKQYLVSNSENQRSFLNYENGLFVYQKKVTSEADTPCGIIKFIINLNNLVGNYGFERGDWHWQGKNIIFRDKSRCSCEEDSEIYSNEFEIDSRDYDSRGVCYNCSFDFYTEDGLRDRMKKAIEQFKKYNSNSGNEAY